MFIYTSFVERAIQDMVQTVGGLAHIDPRRLLVLAGPRACAGRTGNLAQCYALLEREYADFAYWYNPRTRCVVRATPWVRYENNHIEIGGQRMLYLILLKLPRLLAHHPLETLIHELVHIGPDFDGRMHRLRHGKRFDAITAEFARQWREKGNPELVELMDMKGENLAARFGTLAARSFKKRFVARRVSPLENPPPHADHPGLKRKKLLFEERAVEMVKIQCTPGEIPSLLTERDLVYRTYTPTGAARISKAAIKGLETIAFPFDMGASKNHWGK
jgi:hypothetical protein